MLFKIADLYLSIGPDDLASTINDIKLFSHSLKNKADLDIALSPVRHVEKPAGDIMLDDINVWVKRKDSSWSVFYRDRFENDGQLLMRCDASADWSIGSVSYLADSERAFKIVERFLGQIFVKNRIIYHEGLVLHASAVLYQGKVILFTAPSGTGKSTQAQLWSKYMGAEIINDDCPIVRITESGVRAYGSPWSGRSHLFKNLDAPVSTVIVVEQARENRIEKIGLQEAVMNILPRCFLPYHDHLLMSKAIPIVEKIVKKLPVYKLCCTPCEEAVSVTAKCLSH